MRICFSPRALVAAVFFLCAGLTSIQAWATNPRSLLGPASTFSQQTKTPLRALSLSGPSSHLRTQRESRLGWGFSSALRTDLLGQSDLGVLQQAQTTDNSALVVSAIVGIGGALVVVIGNIYALRSKRFQFAWGVAGVATGALASVGVLLVTINSSSTARALWTGFLVLPIALIGLGITNMIQSFWYGGRRFRRRRRFRRYRRYRRFHVEDVQVAPWLNVERETQNTSGGLAVMGRF